MTLYEDLTWRGLVHQVTHPELADLLEKERFTLYCGCDPSADSLHVGTLIPMLTLARFQRHGHTPIVLIGGATGMIGDPSGKASERQLLTSDEVEYNVVKLEVQMRKLLDFGADNAAIVLNNIDWLGQLRLVTFLRDIGKHFSVNMMMARESVRARLEDREQGISFTEFSYQLLQAYDFLQLYDMHDCRLQIGGSDQWGNIVGGMDLTRKLRPEATTFGFTMPLLTKPDGSKFGKTEEGNVWLDPEKTSPYTFYQYWINAPDDEVVKYLKIFTFLTREEIESLEKQVKAQPEKRVAQKALAAEITRMVHGTEELKEAIAASEAMFGGDITGLDPRVLEEIFAEVPSSELPQSKLSGNEVLVDVLVECGVFPSKGEARRMIKSGGVYLNNRRVEADDTKLTEQSLAAGNLAVVRKGKKHYHLLKFV